MIVQLLIIPIAVACVVRTVIFEEIFREFHDWCVDRSKACKWLLQRKFFYLFTCEYCFSHYVTVAFLFMTRFRLLYEGWRGYVMALFCIVFITNLYLNVYSRIRVQLTSERAEAKLKERELNG